MAGEVASAGHRPGGYTRAGTFLVRLTDGRSAFVKAGVDASAAANLRVEARVLAALDGPFAPQVVAWDDDPSLPLLILEDLSDARWPPPYPDDTGPLFAALAAIAGTPHPAGLERLEDRPGGEPGFWERIASAPEATLATGLCTRRWLERAAPVLAEAERLVRFSGDDLLHYDVFSGNVCFVPGRGAVLVDWPTAVIGNRWIDVGFAVVSVLAEGGRLPSTLRVPGGRSIAALLAGHNAVEAAQPLPSWASADATLRDDQLGDLRHALPWAAAELELPPPDGAVHRYEGPRLADDRSDISRRV